MPLTPCPDHGNGDLRVHTIYKGRDTREAVVLPDGRLGEHIEMRDDEVLDNISRHLACWASMECEYQVDLDREDVEILTFQQLEQAGRGR